MHKDSSEDFQIETKLDVQNHSIEVILRISVKV